MDNEQTPDTIAPETNNILPPETPPETEKKDDFGLFFNQDQFNIIRGYKKVHRFLFKHGIYALTILL